jgi:hypothetical protein
MAIFKGLVKQCEVCGKEFKVPQCRANARTCSNECGYVVRAKANSKDKIRQTCEHCGKEFFEHACHASRRRFCSEACRSASPVYRAEQKVRVSGDGNPMWTGTGRSVVSATGKSYRRGAAHKENAKYKRRHVAKLQAVPQWADKAKVDWFYAEAQRLLRATGMSYDVDHIVPLQSKYVCGLHCEFNLQLLPSALNKSKGNKFWPDKA